MRKNEMKIKHLVQSINTGLNPRSNFVLGEGNNFYVTTKNLDGKKAVLDDRCDNITDDALRKINARSDLRAGDVLFSGIGTIGRTAIIKETPKNWNISESLYSLRPKSLITTDFLFYVLNGNKMEDYYLHYQTGSAQKGLRIEDLKNFKADVFDIETQNRIVSFLNEKTLKIDSCIDNEQRLIKELQAFRFSLITKSVLGRLKNKRFKETGIKWMPSIPSHWSFTKIGSNCYLKGRIGWQGLTADEYQDIGPYLITGTDFDNGGINWNTCVHITEKRYVEASHIRVRNGDVLITKDGTVGKVAIVENMPGKASLNSGVMLMRNLKGKYENKYLYYVLSSNVFWDWFYREKKENSTIVHLYQEQFEKFSFPLPPKNEQLEIAEYLDRKCKAVDELIKLKEQKIEKLKEYKKSLIYECVTGRREI